LYRAYRASFQVGVGAAFRRTPWPCPATSHSGLAPWRRFRRWLEVVRDHPPRVLVRDTREPHATGCRRDTLGKSKVRRQLAVLEDRINSSAPHATRAEVAAVSSRRRPARWRPRFANHRRRLARIIASGPTQDVVASAACYRRFVLDLRVAPTAWRNTLQPTREPTS